MGKIYMIGHAVRNSEGEWLSPSELLHITLKGWPEPGWTFGAVRKLVAKRGDIEFWEGSTCGDHEWAVLVDREKEMAIIAFAVGRSERFLAEAIDCIGGIAFLDGENAADAIGDYLWALEGGYILRLWGFLRETEAIPEKWWEILREIREAKETNHDKEI